VIRHSSFVISVGHELLPPSHHRRLLPLALLILFISAAIWLVIGSCFGLISSLKFHSPNFLANSAWLTYGRTRPAYINSMLYGFCMQAGVGVLIWMMTRLGRTVLAQRWLVAIGAKLWNLGVTVGIIGILAGDSTGFETLEMPAFAALIMFLGYLLIAVWTLVAFHRRTVPALIPSQWFLLTALFWFPWIYSTAYLLLVTFPVRGLAQAVIAWWYSANLQTVWFSLVGLGVAFYFIPKLKGRPLRSYYLALFTFWMLILFGSWTGIPNSAPVPAWMPSLSTVATVMMIIPIITVAMNIFGSPALAGPVTGGSGQTQPTLTQTSLRFIYFGVLAWLLAALLSIVHSLTNFTNLTWFVTAQSHLQFYGFFAMILFGAIYYIVPQLVGLEFKSPQLIRLNFWLAAGALF
jgi:cytochrome c oxidase cbb3-type subunit 1